MLPYGVAMGGNLAVPKRSAWALSTVVVVFLAACSSGNSNDTADTATTSAASTIAPATTTVAAARELADSQVSASTVAAPLIPGPCDPADIDVVTLDASIDADQVIELVNRGEITCEVDVSDSPAAAEDLEPNVVLLPGELAKLWISELSACETTGSSVPADFELLINGSSRTVPLSFAPRCGFELWAFYSG